MPNVILVINAGSSSIKFAVFNIAEEHVSSSALYRGEIAGIGHESHFTVHDHTGKLLSSTKRFHTNTDKIPTHEAAFSILFDWLDYCLDPSSLIAIGHRVVHGGEDFSVPTVINEKILNRLKVFIPLAPLHQPYQLAAIETLIAQHPEIPQIACFDTAFHRSQSSIAQQFALPRALRQQGIVKYGFHGLSYEYIAKVLPDYLGDNATGRVIVAHLGHGASMCAMKDSKSVATTMTFSPLDGLPMGTRCGALDAAVVLYLVKEKSMSIEAVSDLLNHKSGLLGVSGISGDMQALLHSDSPQAAEAVDLFVYYTCRELGSLVAALNGLDALVFTAGIGEHSNIIRERICKQASWLGIHINKAANIEDNSKISTPESPVSVWVIPTNEEMIIAEHTHCMIGK